MTSESRLNTGRILLLSQEVPPAPSASAVIVGNLAKQFHRSEMVVAGEDPPIKPPMQWREDWPELHYVVSRWNRRGRNTHRRLMLPLTVVRCVRLARRYNCDTIVTVFPKGDSLFAGYLTAKLTGARFFAYFHNTYVENRTGLGLTFAKWLQSRVFRKAAAIFVMSEGIMELYREQYPEVEFHPLVHSFNETIPRFETPSRPGSPFRFVISGTIHESCLDATVRFCDALSEIEDTDLTILSGTSRAYLEKVGVLRNGWRHITVSRDELVDHLRQADAVMLPHGLTGGFSPAEYRTIFPTKLIEYLICGRPILAHSPDGCFLTRFLRERGCALIVDKPSKQALIDAVERLRNDAALCSELVRNALRTAEMFQAPRVAETFRRHLGLAFKESAAVGKR